MAGFCGGNPNGFLGIINPCRPLFPPGPLCAQQGQGGGVGKVLMAFGKRQRQCQKIYLSQVMRGNFQLPPHHNTHNICASEAKRRNPIRIGPNDISRAWQFMWIRVKYNLL